MTDSALTALANTLMRAVVTCHAVRDSRDADVAVKILREEMKEFLYGAKYADERALVLEGGSQSLAVASLTAECIRRVIAERAPETVAAA